MTTSLTATALHRPDRLHEGDTVAFIAPSAPVPQEAVDEGRAVIEAWGLTVLVGEHVSTVHSDFDYLAGTDAQRARDFEWAWTHPDVRAVFCMRGGYGAQRFVDLVDWERLRSYPPKPLIGYSDITALHQAVARHLGIASIHGPMPGTSTFASDAAAAERLRTTLFAPEATMVLGRDGAHAIVPGVARGITTGGCLALLAGEIGSRSAVKPTPGSIAMLEDVGEDTYRIDGFLTHLLRAGWFDGVVGIVLGSWYECKPVDVLLAERLSPLGVPVLADLGFGHCPDPQTIPLGVIATMDSVAGTVTLDEPALQ